MTRLEGPNATSQDKEDWGRQRKTREHTAILRAEFDGGHDDKGVPVNAVIRL
jgi:hypothetical protein